jgi:hypothetical protein
MSPSSLSKPIAAPVSDSSPRITASSAPRAEAAPAAAKPSPARPSNPALLAHGGGSGFDAGGQAGLRGLGVKSGGGRFDAGAAAPATGTTASSQTSGASAVNTVPQPVLDRLFNRGSSTYEGILKSLGVENLPQIDDPAQRVINRSTVLGDLLKSDPSLVGKISKRDLRKVQALDRIYARVQGSVSGINQIAVNAFRETAALMRGIGDWPPPGGR